MEKIISFFENLRNVNPLVHNITNYVSVNDVANSILAVGGAPLMADAIEEVEDIVSISSALVINIGTLNTRTIKSMIKAGKKANNLGIPVILDPVGVGASKLRNQAIEELLKEVKFTVVKGNMSEIKALYSKSQNHGGVDVQIEDIISETTLDKNISFIKKISKDLNSIIAVTGPIDIVSYSDKVTLIRNGHPNMSKITGTGCMTAAIIGATCGSTKNHYLATIYGIALMGMAGEFANKNSNGIGDFRTKLIDGLQLISQGKIKEGVNIESL